MKCSVAHQPWRRPRCGTARVDEEGARLRHIFLPAVFNPLLTLGILVILPPLFGGAAPLSEIMCLLPDFGMAVGVSVGWRSTYLGRNLGDTMAKIS